MPYDPEQVRAALERTVTAVTLRAGVGRGTAQAVARVGPGLSCQVTDGGHTVTTGLPEAYGGTGADPTPGVLGRAAVASCLALGLTMWAARAGVPLTALEVTVEADYDARGELGLDEAIRPGYLAMRYRVAVSSPAPEGEVRRVLETGIRTSSWLDNLANPVPMTGEIAVSPPEPS